VALSERSLEADRIKQPHRQSVNNAESLVYNSEKTLEELGDKISGEEKAKVETEIENTKKALETNNTETIKDATDKLTKVFYELSEKLYSQAGAANGASQSATTENTSSDGDNVVDADYTVEDDNKNE